MRWFFTNASSVSDTSEDSYHSNNGSGSGGNSGSAIMDINGSRNIAACDPNGAGHLLQPYSLRMRCLTRQRNHLHHPSKQTYRLAYSWIAFWLEYPFSIKTTPDTLYPRLSRASKDDNVVLIPPSFPSPIIITSISARNSRYKSP